MENFKVGQRIETTFATTGIVEAVTPSHLNGDWRVETSYHVRSDAGGTWLGGVLHNLPESAIKETISGHTPASGKLLKSKPVKVPKAARKSSGLCVSCFSPLAGHTVAQMTDCSNARS